MKREGVTYQLHHIGIPTEEERKGERYAERFGMWTSDDFSGSIPVQWHRFSDDSPLHSLIRTTPHVAYSVNDLPAALVGHSVILGPYEPIDGYKVGIIDNAGIPVEFIETSLSDAEIWGRAQSGTQSSMYAKF